MQSYVAMQTFLPSARAQYGKPSVTAQSWRDHLDVGTSGFGPETHSPARKLVRPTKTLLIDNYDSYTYNLYQSLAVVNGGDTLALTLINAITDRSKSK